MKVLLSFSVVPMGVGVSVSEYVAACEKVLEASGVKYQLHANGTNVEAEWDAAFAAIKACHERVHAMGAPRISTVIYAGTRTDKEQTLEDKVESVRAKLG
ncbi:MAG: MTH1187 family thiamine-binding protein [Gammaproteobacteria bacterium]|nr:MTH1187 family thiamine-binding protein [Gammaproteobacteria bacterium]